MTKFEQQSPRQGMKCTFISKLGKIFTGHYEHGGARQAPSVIVYEKDIADIKQSEFHTIDSWEYKN